MKNVLAVASGGGHWVQLLRIRPAFNNCNVTFVSTNIDYKREVSDSKFAFIPDANMKKKFALLLMFLRMLIIVLKHKPEVIISTGAAPGFAAIFWGRLFRVRTIWIDSIANSEELSLCGKHAHRFADLWLTQWEHLSSENGPQYLGQVL